MIMFIKNDYEKIIEAICAIKGIREEELVKILKDKNCRYLMFFLMKKHNCLDVNRLNEDFYIKNKRIVTYGIKKAEKKLLINRDFRAMYFKTQKIIEQMK